MLDKISSEMSSPLIWPRAKAAYFKSIVQKSRDYVKLSDSGTINLLSRSYGVRMNAGSNILSGHNNGLEINIQLPLHAQYQVLDYSICTFFWKRESIQKAKILRKVDYPLELDVYDLCSDELRKQLEGPRQILRDEEGKKLGLKANKKSSGSKDDDVKMTDAKGLSNASGESSVTTSQERVPSDKETRLTRIYDLVAVLTHKGDWHMAYICMYKARTVL
ncbi:hypothetical protein CRYUN_Cryun34aG0101000 [Craigia yunnanensis]